MFPDFVLDPYAGILVAGEHRGEAFTQGYRGHIRELFRVAPHSSNAPGEALFLKFAYQRREMVANVERSAIFGTNGLRSIGAYVFTALGAFKVGNPGH